MKEVKCQVEFAKVIFRHGVKAENYGDFSRRMRLKSLANFTGE
jgi:hypothetical protein